MMKVFVLILLMTCVVFCADGKYIKRGCRIPTGPEFHQAKFRMGRKQLRPGKVIRYGERVTVVCRKDIYGDAIHSWSHHLCRGGWTPSLPNCKAYKRCNAPPEMNNMIATVHINPSRTFPHDHQIRYTCKEGYNRKDNLDFIKCRNGQWTPVSMSCEVNLLPFGKPRKNPSFERQRTQKSAEYVTIQNEQPAECNMNVDNGQLTQTDNGTETYSLHCETGYQPQRENYVCQEGAWRDKSPKCDSKFVEIVTIQTERPAECDNNVNNGHLLQTNNETGTYTLHCETGYKPQRENYVCQEGAWLDKSPKCVSKRCHKIKSDYKLVEGEGLNHGAEIILRCNENTSYPHFGIERAWCFNGQWLPRRPECKNYCELPTDVNSVTDVRTNRPSPRLVMHAVGVHQMCGNGSFQDNKCLNGKWIQDFLQCN